MTRLFDSLVDIDNHASKVANSPHGLTIAAFLKSASLIAKEISVWQHLQMERLFLEKIRCVGFTAMLPDVVSKSTISPMLPIVLTPWSYI